MLDTSFSPWPSFSCEEIEAVSRALRSNRVIYWTGGECRHFEREYAEWVGARYAIAVSNGTVALDLALHGLGIGAANGGSPDDEVIVTPRTFLASVSCVINAGAIPVFADVELDSGNLSAATIAPALSDRTQAIIVVHLAGWPVDMDPIMGLVQSRGIKVIEDCAQAHGARYKGRSVGSIGHVGAWSFCQDKIMTTGGEGGMVTTNDPKLWSRMWSFKDHGKSWDAVFERKHPPGFRWVHESFGTNWRMLEMQAAIGRIQLKRMPSWTKARTRNAEAIRGALAPYAGPMGSVRIPKVEEGAATHAQYKLYAYVRPENLRRGWSRDRIIAEIVACGVPCYQGSCSEVYLERAFEGTGWRPQERCPAARELGETSIMFLVHPTLSLNDIERTMNAIDLVLRSASRNRD